MRPSDEEHDDGAEAEPERARGEGREEELARCFCCSSRTCSPCARRRREERKARERRAAVGRREPGRARDRGPLAKEQAARADGADREEGVGDAVFFLVELKKEKKKNRFEK